MLDLNSPAQKQTDAELSVLGSMMLDKDALVNAMDKLDATAFGYPAHKELFSAMNEIYKRGDPVDLVTLDSELEKRGSLEAIGGLDYLVMLSQYVPTTANVGAYIRIVAEYHALRKLQKIAKAINLNVDGQNKTASVIIGAVEKALYDAARNLDADEVAEPVRKGQPTAYADTEREVMQGEGLNGLPTGFTELDAMLNGMRPGQLIVIGARPAMGKTSLATSIALNASIDKGAKVLFFSLEMTKEEINKRMLYTQGMANPWDLKNGTPEQQATAWMRLGDALNVNAMASIRIDDTSGIRPSQVRARSRKFHASEGLDLIVIDYLQLMEPDEKNANRQLEISAISRALKGIAKELGVAVIACSQLSRANAARGEKRPELSDLRDSGAIEQDADVVMFVHREAYYNEDADPNVAEVIIKKQRNGATGTALLQWDGRYTRFSNRYEDGHAVKQEDD